MRRYCGIIFYTILLISNGTLVAKSLSSKLKPGLYKSIIIKDGLDELEPKITLGSMLNDRPYEVYLYDGIIFRSSGGAETTSVKKRIPFSEYYFCGDQMMNLCPRFNGLNLKIIEIAANKESLICFSNKYNPQEKWIRIKDFNVANGFIKEREMLGLFPGKNLSDFGYIRPEIKFIIANQYKPYVSALILREAPGKKGKKVDTLFSGDILTVTEITKTVETIDKIKAPWVKIKTSTGKEGYVFGGFLEPVGE